MSVFLNKKKKAHLCEIWGYRNGGGGGVCVWVCVCVKQMPSSGMCRHIVWYIFTIYDREYMFPSSG